MTIKDLILELQKYPEDTKVKILHEHEFSYSTTVVYENLDLDDIYYHSNGKLEIGNK